MSNQSNRPECYVSVTGQLPLMNDRIVSVLYVLTHLRKSYGGKVPATLADEAGVVVYASAIRAPFCDLDVESSVFFPNRFYVSRQVIRADYENFVKWCKENGWLTDGDIVTGNAPVAPVEPDDAEDDPYHEHGNPVGDADDAPPVATTTKPKRGRPKKVAA